MTTVFEIPLSPQPTTMTIALGPTTYKLRFHYANVDQGGWLLDISDASGNALVCGIPLVTGADLLAQYAYLGFAGKLFVMTDGDRGAVPTFENLGDTAHVYFATS
ncbi:hypothetical protein [Beijerinckia sp. L45]|uniref:phage baseplate plug family protein n=1 Tax=Beijerinckia sp. L45 TaxID=1641855 RepID=UPI00131B7DF5|nr:hypothetical protein [Beijerinckia sp. L45]